MLKILRLITLFVTPLIFIISWYVTPGLLDPSGIRWLSGIVTVLWALEFFFFQRLIVMSSVEGLSSREHERLVAKLNALRRRVWWIGGIGLICSLLTWVIAALQMTTSSPLYAALVGVLFGISLSYLILIPGWLGESQSFIDELKRRDSLEKKRAAVVKDLS